MRRSVRYALLLFLLSGCQPQNTSTAPQTPVISQAPSGPPKEYRLVGEIINVDMEGKKATIKHEAIEGYMGAMTMSYPIPEQADLDKIKAGDKITATVFDSEVRYWVGNIQVGEPAAK